MHNDVCDVAQDTAAGRGKPSFPSSTANLLLLIVCALTVNGWHLETSFETYLPKFQQMAPKSPIPIGRHTNELNLVMDQISSSVSTKAGAV
jgi:hypothetical protein